MDRDEHQIQSGILDYLNEGLIIIRDDPKRFVYINEAFAGMLGYTVEELNSFSPGQIESHVFSEDRAMVFTRLEERLAGKHIDYRYEYRIIRKDGTAVWVSMGASLIENEGEPAVLATFTDVTDRVHAEKELRRYRDHLEDLVDERKAELKRTGGLLQREIEEHGRTEEALRVSEERYRTISELTSDFAYSFKVKPDGTIEGDWITGAITRISGYTVDELRERGSRMSLVHPGDQELVREHLEANLSGMKKVTEFRIVNKSGEVRWLRDSARPVMDEEGKRPVRIIGAVEDITERKEFQKEIEDRYNELLLLNKLHKVISSSHDRSTIFREILKPVADYCGAKAAGLYEFDYENGKTVLNAIIGPSLGADREYIEEASKMYRAVDFDDEAIQAILASNGVFVTEEDMPGLTSQRQWIKKKLGIKRTIVFVFRSGDRVVAYAALGYPHDRDIPKEKRAFLELLGKQMGIALERLELMDVLEKRKLELKRLATWLINSIEEERRKLSVSLHDDIGQLLVALNVEFDMLEGRIDHDDTEGRNLLARMKEQMRAITDSARKFSYSLHPAMINDLGLVPAIEWYVDRFIKCEALDVEIEAAGFNDELPPDTSLTLYRVIQEALRNVVQHSGAARVSVKITKGYPRVILVVEDNGSGFDLDNGETVAKGLGIVGMRERVRSLGGDFKIKSSAGSGTRIRVTIPLEVNDV